MKNFIKTEWAKLREMNFAEKRWYVWEYYKFQIFGFFVIVFIIGSIINSRLNPRPDEYLYIGWIGISAAPFQLSDLAGELSVIVEDTERQIVVITDYSMTENNQVNRALQTRFMALIQIGAMDAFITTREGFEGLYEEGFIRHVDEVINYSEVVLEERLLAINDEEAPPQFYAISIEGSPLLEQLGIESSDAYLCVILNTQRFCAIAKALEVLIYGA